ncbi:MAG: hypothetical protein AAB897_04105 [Patescibacteria group bacterium]
MANPEIRWSAPEFEERPKGVSWYWLSIIVAVIILGLAVWQRNFLFGFFVVLAEILVLVWGNRQAEIVNFSVTEKGIAIADRKNHLYSELENFSVNDAEGELADIFLRFKSRLKPSLKIRVPKSKLGEVRGVLGSALREVEHQHSLLDALEEFLRF